MQTLLFLQISDPCLRSLLTWSRLLRWIQVNRNVDGTILLDAVQTCTLDGLGVREPVLSILNTNEEEYWSWLFLGLICLHLEGTTSYVLWDQMKLKTELCRHTAALAPSQFNTKQTSAAPSHTEAGYHHLLLQATLPQPSKVSSQGYSGRIFYWTHWTKSPRLCENACSLPGIWRLAYKIAIPKNKKKPSEMFCQTKMHKNAEHHQVHL